MSAALQQLYLLPILFTMFPNCLLFERQKYGSQLPLVYNYLELSFYASILSTILVSLYAVKCLSYCILILYIFACMSVKLLHSSHVCPNHGLKNLHLAYMYVAFATMTVHNRYLLEYCPCFS